jgi:hypothetical protein
LAKSKACTERIMSKSKLAHNAQYRNTSSS